MTRDEYIALQRLHNTYHSDGSIEGNDEPAIAWAVQFSRWIKARDFICNSILDAGCRTGYAMEAFAQEFPMAEVTGIDIVPDFIQMASLRGDALVRDLQNLSDLPTTYDFTFCATSIEHCPDVTKAMAELCHVTTTGIRIITDLESKEKFDANPSHFTRHDDTLEWINVLQQPGWLLVDVHLPKPDIVSMTWLKRSIC